MTALGRVVPDKPEQSLRSGVLLSFQFIDNKRLQGLGLSRSSQLTVTDFLLGFSKLRACRLKDEKHWHKNTLMLPIMSFLTGVKAIEPRRSAARLALTYMRDSE